MYCINTRRLTKRERKKRNKSRIAQLIYMYSLCQQSYSVTLPVSLCEHIHIMTAMIPPLPIEVVFECQKPTELDNEGSVILDLLRYVLKYEPLRVV